MVFPTKTRLFSRREPPNKIRGFYCSWRRSLSRRFVGVGLSKSFAPSRRPINLSQDAFTPTLPDVCRTLWQSGLRSSYFLGRPKERSINERQQRVSSPPADCLSVWCDSPFSSLFVSRLLSLAGALLDLWIWRRNGLLLVDGILQSPGYLPRLSAVTRRIHQPLSARLEMQPENQRQRV